MMTFSFSGSWQDIHAQNAPITTIAIVGNAVAGQQVNVPLSVINFNEIGSLTLTIDYDYSKLHFISGNKNPLLTGIFNIGDNDLGTGIHRLMIGWFGSGASLPDGSWIINLTFNYLTDSPVLQWFEMGPSCEYSDVNTNILSDSPTSTYFINGRICGALPNPGQVAGSNIICQDYAEVEYSIPPIANVIGYSWTVPQGAIIVSGTNTNSIIVDYSANSVSGNITVGGMNECGNGPTSLLPVIVTSHPPTPAISQTGTNLTSDVSNGNQWYLNGELIQGANSQFYTPLLNGEYFDIVSENGCSSDTSNILEVLLTGYNITIENTMSLYPNPATDHVTLKLGELRGKDVKLTLQTNAGLIIKSLRYSEGQAGSEIILRTEALNPGVYILKIESGNTYLSKKILILRE